MMNVNLEGGPDGLPRQVQMSHTDVQCGRIKLAHRNGYETFERVDDAGDECCATFRWAMRTRIAE